MLVPTSSYLTELGSKIFCLLKCDPVRSRDKSLDAAIENRLQKTTCAGNLVLGLNGAENGLDASTNAAMYSAASLYL